LCQGIKVFPQGFRFEVQYFFAHSYKDLNCHFYVEVPRVTKVN
jgi:hypothetical protein